MKSIFIEKTDTPTDLNISSLQCSTDKPNLNIGDSIDVLVKPSNTQVATATIVDLTHISGLVYNLSIQVTNLTRIMKVAVVTACPEAFEGAFNYSMMLKCVQRGLLQVNVINLRDYGVGVRKQIDDSPYGGGDGMVLMIEPLYNALMTAKTELPQASVLLMTPRGRVYNQQTAIRMSNFDQLIIICGHYEGYDQRIVDFVDFEISLGEFVLTGGEIPALAIIDSIVRLRPGVLGGETSATNESHMIKNKLEHPQYTRPEVFMGSQIPKVLKSGHHANINNWKNNS